MCVCVGGSFVYDDAIVGVLWIFLDNVHACIFIKKIDWMASVLRVLCHCVQGWVHVAQNAL